MGKPRRRSDYKIEELDWTDTIGSWIVKILRVEQSASNQPTVNTGLDATKNCTLNVKLGVKVGCMEYNVHKHAKVVVAAWGSLLVSD